jgi:hypothetical protein
MTSLRAGAASAELPIPPGCLLDGYGGRFSPSQGVHDPLMARALVLDYGDEGSAAIVVVDLLGIHPWMAAELRDRARESLGIPEDALLLSATHDHAAPIGLRSGMFSRLDESLAEAIVSACLAALSAAWKSRQPAAIKLGSSQVVGVAMNRRDPNGPVDETLRILLLDGEDGPIASLMSFACHATVLSGRNLHVSAEFPGAACRLVEAVTGAPTVYLQGACGNINPLWMRQDFASVERAGQAVAGAALTTIAQLRALGSGLRVHNIRWDEFPETPVPGRVVEPGLRFTRREIDLPLREFEADEHYASLIDAARAEAESAPASSAVHRAAMARLSRYEGERWAGTWARRSGETGTRRTEVQAIRLGEGLTVVAWPGEFFVETAALVREESGLEDLLVAGYANDYIGYVVPDAAFAEGGYESGVTFFDGEAESTIRKVSLELLREVCPNGE